MERNKFDFRTADALVQAVNATANALDVQNGQMEKRFGNLRQCFKDEGYEEFSGDMTSANRAMESVIEQLKQVGKAIADYSEQLKGVM